MGLAAIASCFYFGGCMSAMETHGDCSDAWRAISAREYRHWNGLPETCHYPDFETTFRRLRDEFGQGTLGRTHHAANYRMHVGEGYPQNLKVWFRGEDILLIESRHPKLPCFSQEFLRHLGKPEKELDYHLDVMRIPAGAWVYPARGITVFLDAGRNEVMGIALFHPCSLTKYLDEIHPDARMHELPFRG